MELEGFKLWGPGVKQIRRDAAIIAISASFFWEDGTRHSLVKSGDRHAGAGGWGLREQEGPLIVLK